MLKIEKDNYSKSEEEKNLEQMTLEELKQMIPPKELLEAEKLALKKWLEAPLSDNDVFINFCNNENMCRALVHIFLKYFNVQINKPQIVYEKSANIDFDSKEVRFDIYVEDDYIIVDMEMKVVIKLMSPKRIRTYQAVIDMEQIKKSNKYNALKDTYIIIICLDDPFGYGAPAYRIKKSPEPLELGEFGAGEFNIDNYIDNEFDKSIMNDIEEFDKNKLEDYLKKFNRKHKKAKCKEYIDGANILFFDASTFMKVKNKELRAFLAFIMGFHFKDCQFYYLIKERYDKTKINEKARLSFMTSYFRELDRRTIMREELITEVTEEVIQQVTQDITKKVTQDVTKKVTQDVTKKVTQDITKKVTQDVTQQVTQEIEEKAYQKQIKMILNMLNIGHSSEIIHSITEMPIEEIDKIKEKYNK